MAGGRIRCGNGSDRTFHLTCERVHILAGEEWQVDDLRKIGSIGCSVRCAAARAVTRRGGGAVEEAIVTLFGIVYNSVPTERKATIRAATVWEGIAVALTVVTLLTGVQESIPAEWRANARKTGYVSNATHSTAGNATRSAARERADDSSLRTAGHAAEIRAYGAECSAHIGTMRGAFATPFTHEAGRTIVEINHAFPVTQFTVVIPARDTLKAEATGNGRTGGRCLERGCGGERRGTHGRNG